jgi:hypothetical protein
MSNNESGAGHASYCPHCGKPLQALVLWGERRRLPNNRRNETNNFPWQGRNGAEKTWSYTIGFYPNGEIGELFIDAPDTTQPRNPMSNLSRKSTPKTAPSSLRPPFNSARRSTRSRAP